MRNFWHPQFGDRATVDNVRFAMRTRGMFCEQPWAWRGLVGWWPFVEGGGLLAHDWSGYGNHGTLTNMAPASDWVDEITGTALDFDGSNDYVNVNDSAIYSFGDGSTDRPFSISAWVCLGSGTTGAVMSKYGTFASGAREWTLGMPSSGVLRLQVVDGSTNGHSGRDTGNVLVADTWQHIACTYSGINAKDGIDIYVDAVVSDTSDAASGSYTAMESTSSNVNIGGTVSDSFYLSSKIRDVRIYDRSLSSDEIRQIYQNPNGIFRSAIRPAIGKTSAAAAIQHQLLMMGVG